MHKHLLCYIKHLVIWHYINKVDLNSLFPFTCFSSPNNQAPVNPLTPLLSNIQQLFLSPKPASDSMTVRPPPRSYQILPLPSKEDFPD